MLNICLSFFTLGHPSFPRQGKLGATVFTDCLLMAVTSAGLSVAETNNFTSNRYTAVKPDS